MKALEIKYKNIDKSTTVLLDEPNTFSVLNIHNKTSQNEYFKHQLNGNFIHLYFCCNEVSTIAFNMEHCAIKLQEGNAGLVYFKDDKMNVLFDLQPNASLVVVLISVQYFHSLFSHEGNYLFNFSNFSIDKPIIESKATTPSIKVVLSQLLSKNLNESLRPIYIKGKVYELLSLYFNISNEVNSENCPYIPNESTMTKIKQAKDIIIDQMINPPSLEELSKTVGLNIKKLKMGFKEYYGAPVYTFLFSYRMEIAKKLLLDNDLNVNEIALQVGYSNSSHFIAAFKRKFGITPKQFSKS